MAKEGAREQKLDQWISQNLRKKNYSNKQGVVDPIKQGKDAETREASGSFRSLMTLMKGPVLIKP